MLPAIELMCKLHILFPQSNVYVYGSEVYGSTLEGSDYDFILVSPKPVTLEEQLIINDFCEKNNADVNIYSAEGWQFLLDRHEVRAVETQMTPVCYKIQPQAFKFKLDLAMLRASFSHAANNSWVKAKKKLTVEPATPANIWLAQKSLFHSFRILDLGIQIAQGIELPDFGSMNLILREVYVLHDDWELWDKTFRERHNALTSKFREVAPKC